MEQLESFITIAKLKSFIKAAEELNITQPGISRRIKSLEEDLGVNLFLRTPQSVVITKQGKEFLPYAERAIQILKEGKERALVKKRAEKLTIAATPTISTKVLPKLIENFQSKMDIMIQLHTASSQEIFDMMLDQTIDFGFTSNIFSNPLLKYEKLYSEEICCVAKPEFIEKYVVNGVFLHERIPTIYTNGPVSQTWSFINQYLVNSPYLKIVVEAHTTPLVLYLVKAGIGMAIVPYSDVKEELKCNELVKVTLPDFQLPLRSVYFLSYKDKPLSNIEAMFKETIFDSFPK